MQKVYLAGPDVFAPNAVELGNRLKALCKANGFEGLFPLDNEIADSSLSKKEKAFQIVKANMKMINSSDYVLANLSNFRGTELHPYCDSGTAWECGYAIGKNKIVIGYTNSFDSIPEEIISHLHLVSKISSDFTLDNLLKDIVFFHFRVKNSTSSEIFRPFIPKLDPPYPDIQDANAGIAFQLGLRCAMNTIGKISISDSRTQIEKYGEKDKNGYYVEDFDYPVNIMIAVNSI